MKKAIRVDKLTGMYIEDRLFGDRETIPSNFITVPCPDGFYHPKWDGSKWVEGLSSEEITKRKVKGASKNSMGSIIPEDTFQFKGVDFKKMNSSEKDKLLELMAKRLGLI